MHFNELWPIAHVRLVNAGASKFHLKLPLIIHYFNLRTVTLKLAHLL
jgi:hypothetical protein